MAIYPNNIIYASETSSTATDNIALIPDANNHVTASGLSADYLITQQLCLSHNDILSDQVNCIENSNIFTLELGPYICIETNSTTTNFYGHVWEASSSLKIKYNIKPIKNIEKLILSLHPVSFTYKKDPKQQMHFGLIYEEVYKILPHICYTDNKNNKYICYDELIPYLLRAVQDLRERIDKLKKLKQQKN